jgi:hypothetical protein
MTTIVRLITNSTAAFVVLCKERLRHIVPMRRPQERLLIDQVQGFAQLELPDGWRAARDLNETAGIEAIHARHGRHVIIISDAVDDFVPEMTVFEHSVNTRDELTNNLRIIGCSGPDRRTVGGFDAVQYEIEGYFHQTRIKYLHTTVAGQRAYHQVLAWATPSRYNREVFENLLNGFTEIPSIETVLKTLPPTESVEVIPVSRYDVH